jgi:hypothetical protein
METIKSIFHGDTTKKNLTSYYLPLAIGLYLFFLFLAWLFYPYVPEYPYDWTTSMISRLGWTHENTIGWIFFSIAFVILGVFFLSLVPYFYKRFRDLKMPGSKFVSFAMLVGSIGFLGIGAIPNFPPNIFGFFHALNALLILVGVFIVIIALGFFILKEHLSKGMSNSIIQRKLIILYFIVLTYILISGYFLISADSGHSDRFYIHDFSLPLISSRAFWEWQVMMTSIGLIAIICFIIPEKREKL